PRRGADERRDDDVARVLHHADVTRRLRAAAARARAKWSPAGRWCTIAIVLAERPLPRDLDERLTSLAEQWSRDPEIAALYLFGSRAKGVAGPRSDVDLAVVLGAHIDEGQRFRKRLALLEAATRALATDAV